jgi:hypothetical protein
MTEDANTSLNFNPLSKLILSNKWPNIKKWQQKVTKQRESYTQYEKEQIKQL